MTPAGDLGTAVLAHLDAQLRSARRLLDIVLRQGVAIRRQDVEAVLARLDELQGEMERRTTLEGERTALLARAGAALGVPPGAITLDALTALMTDPEAAAARERSAELRGMLGEISREHGVNRALMRQELAFLDHLTRMLSGDPHLGYRPPADGAGARLAPAPTGHRVLDLQA